MNSPTDKSNDQAHTTAQTHAAGFEMAADDPRRTDNRGGLEAIVDAGETAIEEHAVENAVEQNRDVDANGSHAPDKGLPDAEDVQAEVMDYGLIDVHSSGTSVRDEDEQQSDGAARVEGSDGQPL